MEEINNKTISEEHKEKESVIKKGGAGNTTKATPKRAISLPGKGSSFYWIPGQSWWKTACMPITWQAAVNAVYENKIMALPPEERPAFVQQKREEYAKDVDNYRLASELVVDHMVSGTELRDELIRRFALYESKDKQFAERKHPVYPV